MRVAIVGAGLAGMATAMDLVDGGCEVEIFESRPFVGGKVGSWVDKDGNHIEMGLHVFFGCYYNLFALMKSFSLKEILALNIIISLTIFLFSFNRSILFFNLLSLLVFS